MLANQRPWRPSCFSDRPEKHKLGRGCRDLAFFKVLTDLITNNITIIVTDSPLKKSRA